MGIPTIFPRLSSPETCSGRQRNRGSILYYIIQVGVHRPVAGIPGNRGHVQAAAAVVVVVLFDIEVYWHRRRRRRRNHSHSLHARAPLQTAVLSNTFVRPVHLSHPPCRLDRRNLFESRFVCFFFIVFRFWPFRVIRDFSPPQLFRERDTRECRPTIVHRILIVPGRASTLRCRPHDSARRRLCLQYMFSPEKTRTGTGGQRWYVTCLGYKSKNDWSSLELKVSCWKCWFVQGPAIT